MNNNKEILKSALSNAWEVAKMIIISLLIIVPVRYWVFQPFFVKGASMEPTFQSGDYLIIDEFSYNFLTKPERGEVIVFKYPKNPSDYYIKRVIGLPGETIEVKNGFVVVTNKEYPGGHILNEAYLEGHVTYGDEKITLGQNEYFVLGDNREFSSDSRRFGAVDKKYLVGKVLVRAWPIKSAEVFAAPIY